jgi:hypothetical protein
VSRLLRLGNATSALFASVIISVGRPNDSKPCPAAAFRILLSKCLKCKFPIKRHDSEKTAPYYIHTALDCGYNQRRTKSHLYPF